MSKFHRTAISRNNFSTPVQYLLENELLTKKGTKLDYGCGRGYDVEHLKMQGYNIEGFDPYGDYKDFSLLDTKYNTIMCNYVLNVIEDEQERVNVEKDII